MARTRPCCAACCSRANSARRPPPSPLLPSGPPPSRWPSRLPRVAAASRATDCSLSIPDPLPKQHTMAAVICGSLAFDTIMTFEGRFAQQILPDQLHILNVSFLVPALRRDFGGCAGNIAYALKKLGGVPLPMATLGTD